MITKIDARPNTRNESTHMPNPKIERPFLIEHGLNSSEITYRSPEAPADDHLNCSRDGWLNGRPGGYFNPDQLSVDYACRIDPAGETDFQLQSWRARLNAVSLDEDCDSTEIEIGSATFRVLSLDAGQDELLDVLDDADEDIFQLGQIALNGGFLHEKADDFNKLIIFDHLEIRQDLRGRGVGPHLADTIIKSFSAGQDTAAAFKLPSPDEARYEPEESDSLHSNLEAIATQNGFTHDRENVWFKYVHTDFMSGLLPAGAVE